MTLRRKRKCSECNKPLGGTFGKCHECGGEKSKERMMYRWARSWKIALGVFPSKIKKAHDESKERNPHYDEEEEEWR